jgi:glycosyltransferase involved in cell wall biosynthesis
MHGPHGHVAVLGSDSGNATTGMPRFVLVTPARNEGKYIEATIQAVVAQSLRPLRWVIVSDGSTDETDDIVRRYCELHNWIQLVRAPERTERNFAGKVHAFNAGWAALQCLDFDVVGSLDADITFEPDFFQVLLDKLRSDPRLGVVGAPFVDENNSYDFRFSNVEHVSGACQLFRKSCFRDIGGYVPIPGGGIDWIAVTTARMKGWRTRTFSEVKCRHHRVMGTAHARSVLRVRFSQGQKDYRLGGHPLWQLVRGVYQLRTKPRISGALCLVAGFHWELVRGGQKNVSAELQSFHRAEQMSRLKRQLSKAGGFFGIGRSGLRWSRGSHADR